jgi:hypothetical protein
MRRDRFLWAGQWTVALAFYFIALIRLGLENRLRASEAFEIALALLAIVPAYTEILPRLSTLALALLPVAGLALQAHDTGLAPLDGTLAVVAAIVALARLKLGYAVPSASSSSSADGLSSSRQSISINGWSRSLIGANRLRCYRPGRTTRASAHCHRGETPPGAE